MSKSGDEPRCAACLLVLGLWSCAALPEPAEPGICGNLILEPGEACDGYSDPRGATCGAPGSAVACRLICSSTPTCPAGAVCGLDGQCRTSARGFGDPVPLGSSSTLFFSTSSLVVGDVDGDGLADLVDFTGSRGDVLRVRFGDPQRGFAASSEVGIATPLTPPVLVPRVGGGHDLVLSTVFGTLTVLLDRGRVLQPKVVPFSEVPLGPPVVLPHQPDGVYDHLAVAHTSGDRLALHFPLEGISGDPLELPEFNAPFAEPYRVFSAGLDRRAGAGPYLFIWRPGSGVLAWQALQCFAFGGCVASGAAQSWTFSDTLLNAPLVHDLNRDGRADLIRIGADETGAPTLQVAYGDGEGRLCGQPFEGTTCASGQPFSSAPLPLQGGSCPNFGPVGLQDGLQAIGDLNGDGDFDLMTDTAIFVRTPEGYEARGCLSRSTAGARPLVVKVADFDDDELADVAVLFSESVELLYGSRSGFFGRSRVFGGLSSANDLEVGDFDDDGAADLVVAEGSGALWIWKGAKGGAAAGLQRAGRSSTTMVQSVVVGHFAGPEGITQASTYPSADALSDVVSLAVDGRGVGVSELFLGTGIGQLLPVGGAKELRFGAEAGRLWLGALGPSVDQNPDLLFMSPSGPRWARLGVDGGGFGDTVELKNPPFIDGVIDQIDVDGDGQQELLLLGSANNLATGTLATDGENWSFVTRDLWALPVDYGLWSGAVLTDLGGPQADLVALTQDLTSPEFSYQLQVRVDGAEPETISLEQELLYLEPPLLIRARLEPGGQEVILVSSAFGVDVLRGGRGDLRLEPWFRTDDGVLQIPGRQGLSSSRSLAAPQVGDVDGDQLPDLVTVEIYSQRASLLPHLSTIR